MIFWFAVILVCGVLLIGMIGTLWILARGSKAKRRWTLVALLLNEEMNAPGESVSQSAKERREAKKLLREQQSHLHAKSHVHHSQHHGGHWGISQVHAFDSTLPLTHLQGGKTWKDIQKNPIR
jgi:hypothetical protein